MFLLNLLNKKLNFKVNFIDFMLNFVEFIEFIHNLLIFIQVFKLLYSSKAIL